MLRIFEFTLQGGDGKLQHLTLTFMQVSCKKAADRSLGIEPFSVENEFFFLHQSVFLAGSK